jgi:hypothetical protein
MTIVSALLVIVAAAFIATSPRAQPRPPERPYSCRLLDDAERKCAFGQCDRRENLCTAILLPSACDRDEALVIVRELSRSATHLRQWGEFPLFGVGIVTVGL